MSGFAPKLVRLIFEIRDNEACFNCRRGLRWQDRGMGWSMHHRRPRGMGGSSEEWVNEAPNALTLCGSGTTGCHGWVETHRAEAYERGLLIHRLGSDLPGDVPVRREDGSVWWLTRWGSLVEVGEDAPT